MHVVDTLSERSPQVVVLGGSWCCCVELLPTQILMLCSFEGTTEGHCSGAGDILLFVIGVERKMKVAEVAEDAEEVAEGVTEEAAEEATGVAEEDAEVIEVIEASGLSAEVRSLLGSRSEVLL